MSPLAAIMHEGGLVGEICGTGVGGRAGFRRLAGSEAAALRGWTGGVLRGVCPVSQVSMRDNRVSTQAKIGWFGVERGRWSRTLRLSTSTVAANLIRRRRRVSN